MELTLQSALSWQGALGHLSYVLLVASMLMRRMLWLRLLVIASAIIGITYSSLVLTDPVGTFWEVLLITANVGQLGYSWWQNRSTQFDARESLLREMHFTAVAPRFLRTLLRAGRWVNLKQGDVLVVEGKPLSTFAFLASGSALVIVNGHVVGRSNPGTLIGEMTVLSGEPASADIVIDADSTLWVIDAEVLRALAGRRPQLKQALEATFFRTLRGRVIERNRIDTLEKPAES
jgi:hypothetical protein